MFPWRKCEREGVKSEGGGGKCERESLHTESQLSLQDSTPGEATQIRRKHACPELLENSERQGGPRAIPAGNSENGRCQLADNGPQQAAQRRNIERQRGRYALPRHMIEAEPWSMARETPPHATSPRRRGTLYGSTVEGKLASLAALSYSPGTRQAPGSTTVHMGCVSTPAPGA